MLGMQKDRARLNCRLMFVAYRKLLVFLCLCLMASGFGGLAVAEDALPTLRYLRTDSGQLRGWVFHSDLITDAPAWHLWRGGDRLRPLRPLSQHLSQSQTQASLAFNGGFWSPAYLPVGVLWGEQGLGGVQRHPTSWVVGERRAWIGSCRMRLWGQTDPFGDSNESTERIFFNPEPGQWHGRHPALFDSASYPAPLSFDFPVRLAACTSQEPEAGARLGSVWREFALGPWRTYAPGERIEVADDRLWWCEPTNGERPPTGPNVRLRLELEVEGERIKPEQVRLATSAGPLLLDAGRIAEGLAPAGDALAKRDLRTAVGLDRKGEQLWVVMLARGRDGNRGATLRETAQLLADVGAWQALNLDGGSSSSVWLREFDPHLHALFPVEWPIHHAIAFHGPLRVEPFLEKAIITNDTPTSGSELLQ